jgi:hypothetical protein
LGIIGILFEVIGWGAVGFIAYRYYKKQETKPKIWKIIALIFIGLFSFSINWPLFDNLIRISILPLGVWILYFLKGKQGNWPTYRQYAWLGFFANFIFLATALLSILVNQAVYPIDKPQTYLANVEDASIINIHPTGKTAASLNKDIFKKDIAHMTEEQIQGQGWYEQSETSEVFPYQLIGAQPKFGSNRQAAVIYVENDGKGLLIQTPKKHYYFRSAESFLKEGN